MGKNAATATATRRMTMTMTAIVAATVIFIALFGPSRAASTWPIEEGKEYQLGIEEDDFGDGVEKRSSAIGEYVEFFTDYLMVRRFNTDFQEEIDMRSEGHFKINKCNPPDSTKVRLRIWFEGNSKGLSSVDLKYFKEGATRSDALRQPLGPSEQYFDQASQDIEEDVHACKRDYSRTTKIYFAPPDFVRPNITTRAKDPVYPSALPDIKTCADMRALFPFALDERMDSQPVEKEYDSKPTTYVYRLIGGAPSGSEIVFTFTLEYKTPEDAKNAKNLHSSEFSITYSALDGGFGGFDVAELKIVEDLFSAMLDEFGSPGDSPCIDDDDDDDDEADDKGNAQKNNDLDSIESDSSSLIPSFFAILSLFLLSHIL